MHCLNGYFCPMSLFEEKNPTRTPLSELGEFGLIDHLTQNFKIEQPSTLKGVGDDAAVLTAGKDHVKVVTSDMLVEGVHFDLSYAPLKHLGYKSVVVNLSDICAMNAVPTQILVSLALSNRFPVEAVEELYEGIYAACARYEVDLVGGDTTSSTSGLIVSITAIGEAKADEVVYRNTAKAGDLLVVSGDLGGAYMGLQILEREKAVYQEDPNMQPDLSGNEYVLERQLKPEPRTDIIKLLKEMGVHPTSMIDVSDGLSSETLHLARQSKLGARIYEDKLPMDPTVLTLCEEFQLDPTIPVLNGGEDYELLFTVDQKDFDKINGNPNLSIVGHMTADEGDYYFISKDGQAHPLNAQGWNALLKKNEEKNKGA